MFYFGLMSIFVGALLGYGPSFVIDFFQRDKTGIIKILGFIMCMLGFLIITKYEYPKELEWIRIIKF